MKGVKGFQKGHTINLGRTLTPEIRAKISAATKGVPKSPEGRANIARGRIGNQNGRGLLGKPKTAEHIANLKHAAATSKQRRLHGAEHPNWKGGVTPINHAIRASLQYKTWRRHVFQRDDFTCQSCTVRGVELHADHVMPFASFPDLRFEILNGRTLCVPCHKKTPTYRRSSHPF